MKAQLQQQEIFTLDIGGLTLRDVKIESQWCGLTRLLTTGGESLIVTGLADRKNPVGYRYAGAFGDIFGELFGTSVKGGDDPKVEVLLITPSLLEKINAVTPKAPA